MLYLFARYGGRRFLDRHPHFFGLTPKGRARMDAWFQHPAGETLVFFLRMLPFLRAAVSIPAGLANMDIRKFTVYSAAGSALFNGALAYSAYAARTNPDVMLEVKVATAYAVSRWPFFLALVLIASVAASLLYRRRQVYRQAPEIAVRHVVWTSSIAAVAARRSPARIQSVCPECYLSSCHLDRSGCGKGSEGVWRVGIALSPCLCTRGDHDRSDRT